MKTLYFTLLLSVLACSAHAQPQADPVATERRPPVQRAFTNAPAMPPETKTDLTLALEPGYIRKAGGDVFAVKIGADRFRYEYQGEYIEFEPLNHLPLAQLATANELYFSSYWTNTNLRFAVHPYGVKVDIILMSKAAPEEFSFRISKSVDWRDEWIQDPYLIGYDINSNPLPPYLFAVDTEVSAGVMTYRLNQKDREQFSYPLIIDPTFQIGIGVDDARGFISTSPGDANQYDVGNTDFGRYQQLGFNTDVYNWLRYSLDIPRASNITASNISYTAAFTTNGAFNTYFARLDPAGSPAWTNTGGFDRTNYSNCSALLAIVQDATQVSFAPPTWTAASPYDSPDIATLVQEQMDDLLNYDPLVTASSYIGFYTDDGDGTYIVLGATSDFRLAYAYESDPANDAELDVTFEPWAEIRTANGMKYNAACDCFKYYDY
jgi:hypothetical protein